MRYSHIPISNVRLDYSQHVDGSLVQFHKNSIVDLEQAEKLKDLANTRTYSIDTEKNNIANQMFVAKQIGESNISTVLHIKTSLM